MLPVARVFYYVLTYLGFVQSSTGAKTIGLKSPTRGW